jgi:hypothetical protein
MEEYIITCRECGKKRKSSPNNYSRNKKQLCRSCSKKGKRNHLYGNSEVARKANSLIKNRRGNTTSWTTEQKLQRSECIRNSPEWLEKCRLGGYSKRGKKVSQQARKNLRIGQLVRLEKTVGQLFPNYNKNLCNLFNHINKELGWSGQHAENGGEYHLKLLGYWLDYYEPTQNVVIEFYEKYHLTRNNQIEKDELRRKEIIRELNCKFIILTEETILNWKELL